MKKLLLFVAVVTAISFASCKKDHVCTCVTSPGGSTTVITYTKSKKGDAAEVCINSTNTSTNVAGITTTTTTTCTLK